MHRHIVKLITLKVSWRFGLEVTSMTGAISTWMGDRDRSGKLRLGI